MVNTKKDGFMMDLEAMNYKPLDSEFKCKECKEILPNKTENSISMNYGIDSQGQKTCLDCCGKLDAEMLNSAEIGERVPGLYLTVDKNNGGPELGTVSNWPGTLKIHAGYISKSLNNFRAERRDIWFTFKGKRFWGYSLGDSQILHAKRIKDR